VRERPAGAVPAHLRDAHYRSAAKLGHGVGYDYPHDDPRGWVPQQYRPPEVADRTYYEPSAHGHEREIADRMREHTEATDDRDGE
jgi:putative ATPase